MVIERYLSPLHLSLLTRHTITSFFLKIINNLKSPLDNPYTLFSVVITLPQWGKLLNAVVTAVKSAVETKSHKFSSRTLDLFLVQFLFFIHSICLFLFILFIFFYYLVIWFWFSDWYQKDWFQEQYWMKRDKEENYY